MMTPLWGGFTSALTNLESGGPEAGTTAEDWDPTTEGTRFRESMDQVTQGHRVARAVSLR